MRIYLIAPAPTDEMESASEVSMAGVAETYTLSASSGIATVAAFMPEGAEIRLCDEIVQQVDFDEEATDAAHT